MVGARHGARCELGEQLGDVTHRVGEVVGAVGAKQLAVLLHRRAASGRGHHHPIMALQGGDGRLGSAPGLVLAAGVKRQRTAAALAGRHVHVAARRRQRRHRRLVHPAEIDPLHAAFEQRHSQTPLARRGRVPGWRRTQIGE